MNFKKFFKLITLLQNSSTSYRELVEFVFKETPPHDHNFLARVDERVIQSIVLSKSSAHYSQASAAEVLFSIIVPTYNGERRIHDTLLSLAGQKGFSYEQYEIIVVDDGSSDATGVVVRDFLEKNSKIRMVYMCLRRNIGCSGARNVGIVQSRGKLIAFTDDDCVVPENWLSTFSGAFLENPEIVGVGGWYRTDENKNESIYDWFLYKRIERKIAYSRKDFSVGNYCGNTANVCYRKKDLVSIGGFSPYFIYPSSEDWELKTRFLSHQMPLLFLPFYVRHVKRHTLRTFFTRYCVVRGWSYMLLSKLYPNFPRSFHVSMKNFVKMWISDLRMLWYGEIDASLTYKEKLLFFGINSIYYTGIVMGKYLVPIEKILWDD